MENIRILPCGLISRNDAAEYLGLKPNTLATWNSHGKHEEYFEKKFIGGRVFYDFEKVKSFIEQ
jgi:hypothetical protein